MHLDNQKTLTPFYAGYAAVVIVAILIAAKSYAYYYSGSVSVLTSLIDSVVDSIVSLMALGSLYYASRPADEDHRSGHGKMEAVSALFQAALIVGAAVFLILESLNRFFVPTEVMSHNVALVVMGISLLMTVVLVAIQRFAIRRTQSLVIEADSAHYSSDILVTFGAMLVLGAGLYGAPLWIDPVFAIIVSALMVFMARGIAMKSLAMLLDRELPEADRDQIIKVIEAHEAVLGWHDLRTHMNGQVSVMSFDIEVDPDLSLWAAHAITKDLEESILQLYPHSDILIHVDPEGFIEDARHRVKGVHH